MLFYDTTPYTCTAPTANCKPITLADVTAAKAQIQRSLDEIKANSPLEKIKRYREPWMYVGAGISDEFCNLAMGELEERGLILNGWARSQMLERNEIAFIDLAEFRW